MKENNGKVHYAHCAPNATKIISTLSPAKIFELRKICPPSSIIHPIPSKNQHSSLHHPNIRNFLAISTTHILCSTINIISYQTNTFTCGSSAKCNRMAQIFIGHLSTQWKALQLQ